MFRGAKDLFLSLLRVQQNPNPTQDQQTHTIETPKSTKTYIKPITTYEKEETVVFHHQTGDSLTAPSSTEIFYAGKDGLYRLKLPNQQRTKIWSARIYSVNTNHGFLAACGSCCLFIMNLKTNEVLFDSYDKISRTKFHFDFLEEMNNSVYLEKILGSVYLLMANNSGSICFIELGSMKSIFVTLTHAGINYAALSSKLNKLCVVGDFDHVKVIEYSDEISYGVFKVTKEDIIPLPDIPRLHTHFPQYCTFSNDCSKLAFSMESGHAFLYSLVDSKCELLFSMFCNSSLFGIKFHPKNRFLAYATRTKVFILECYTFEVQTLEFEHKVTGIHFCPDGTKFFVAHFHGICEFDCLVEYPPSLVNLCCQYINTNLDKYWPDYDWKLLPEDLTKKLFVNK